jgi:hypothetical protein
VDPLYFKATGKSEIAKMMVAALAMRGGALKWWLWWSRHHPQSDWDTFTTGVSSLNGGIFCPY